MTAIDKIRSESWKPVPNTNGKYLISNHGEIIGPGGFGHKCRKKLKLFNTGKGYLAARIRYENGPKTKLVHSLVLEAFVGARPKNMEACHLDGVRDNNKLSNLKWGTRKENHGHKKLHGTHQAGSKNPVSKLNEKDVRYIRENFKRVSFHDSNTDRFMKEFGLARSTINDIVNRKRWKHI